MCGILGSWRQVGLASDTILEMAASISSRGPDSEGIWRDDDAGVVLVHKRLSILDLSPQGAQPMASEDGRYQIIFNGEIYNHRLLRSHLAEKFAYTNWRGTSDTETLLAVIQYLGAEEALALLDGMFALAVWDRQEKKLTLARDKFGEKPLFWGYDREHFLFSSELKPFILCKQWSAEISTAGIYNYLKYGYVPHPYSMLNNVAKLEPGHFITVSDCGRTVSEPRPFRHSLAPEQQQISANDEVSLDQLDKLMRAAVKSRLISDVPVGSLLSGGIDSSLITAIMRDVSDYPIKTFSVGFSDHDFNEALFAKNVSAVLGTDHFETQFNAADAESILMDTKNIFDEPIADPSVLPMFHLNRTASQHVKVVLSGDGADELFAGYNRHFIIPRLETIRRKVPSIFHKPIAKFFHSLSTKNWLSRLTTLLPKRVRILNVNDKFEKLALIFECNSAWDAYERMLVYWPDPAAMLLRKERQSISFKEIFNPPNMRPKDLLTRMQNCDQEYYLPNDILTKVDRTSMRHGLECRAPFLTPALADFAAALPIDKKIQGARGKLILRRLLGRYLDEKLFDRPKTGFGVPLDAWLRRDLRSWAEELVHSSAASSQGVFKPSVLENTWHQYLEGGSISARQIWCLLVLQNWLTYFERTRKTISEL